MTQLIISLKSSRGECNVATVVKRVEEEVGFELVLRDCKLFPFLNNDTISGVDFWKSTCKVHVIVAPYVTH